MVIYHSAAHRVHHRSLLVLGDLGSDLSACPWDAWSRGRNETGGDALRAAGGLLRALRGAMMVKSEIEESGVRKGLEDNLQSASKLYRSAHKSYHQSYHRSPNMKKGITATLP
jgi:hypothetical protein